MKTFEELASKIKEIEVDALYYHAKPEHPEHAGNIPPRAYEAYAEAWDEFGKWDIISRPQFVLVDVVYHAKGWSALYQIDTRTGQFSVAQD